MFVALRRIHVSVSDFARSRRYYGETLGLPEAGSFEKDWVEFALGPVILKLMPLRPGEVPSRNQVALVLSTETLDVTLAALKERGVTVTRSPADEFTGRSAEILDPDGYRIVVFQAGELHPDEEWIPASRVEETVKERVAQWRLKEKARIEKETPKRPEKSKKKPPARPAPALAKAPAKAAPKAAPKAAAKAAAKAAKKPLKKVPPKRAAEKKRG